MRKRSNYKIKVNCSYCDKEKLINPCRYKEGKKYYCNPEHQHEDAKGNILPEETKRKISDTKGGIKMDKRICVGCGIEFEVPKWSKHKYHDRQCSSHFIGKQSHTPWNKGLDKNDPLVADIACKQSQTMQDRYETGEIEIWNKGLTKDTDSRVAAGVDKLTTLRNTDGPWKDAWKKSMSVAQVRAHAAGKYPITFTKPEKLTWAYLESVGHTVKAYKDRLDTDPPNTWYHQYNFFDDFTPDFACPDLKYVLEVDGCYHHGHNPGICPLNHKIVKHAEENKKRDRRKHSLYHRSGWKWANVWECEAQLGDFHRIKKYLT